MSEPERRLIRDILSRLDADTDRLFRINAGTGWVGRVVKHTGSALVLADPRPLRAAPPGWPDLFGWQSHTVTEADVGRVLAVARGVEVKAGRDRLRLAQRRFRDVLESMGGVYEVVTDRAIRDGP